MTTADSTTGTQGAAAEKTVIAEVRGSVGFLELNRPKSLNSLDTEMCQIIHSALDEWREDDTVSGVVIYSNNPKAFCAGGDVRVIREAILDGQPEVGDHFLDIEYSMNAAVVDFPKPYIALIDGIVMGGGLGVSAHGSRRVVSERSWASMPEMAIGFCPDVGVTYAFQRMVNASGKNSFPLAKFLVLTTWRLSPQDMLWSGLATDYVPSEKFEQLREALEQVADADGMNAVIDQFAEPLEGTSQLSELMEHIEVVFDAASWEQVVTQLEACPSEEFQELVRGHLAQANPSSLVATMELMDANERVDSVQDALANEFAVGKVLREDKNFVEGVRAVLVDKGRDAVFDPATTAEVDVEKFRSVVN